MGTEARESPQHLPMPPPRLRAKINFQVTESGNVKTSEDVETPECSKSVKGASPSGCKSQRSMCLGERFSPRFDLFPENDFLPTFT